jgi:hypothetical protein
VSDEPPAQSEALHPVSWKAAGTASAGALLLFLLSVESTAFWGDSASFASHLDTAPKPFARSYWLYKMRIGPIRALMLTHRI